MTPASVLTAVYEVNQCHLVHHRFSRSTCSRTEPFGKTFTRFNRPNALRVTQQVPQCQSTEGNSKHWTQSVACSHSFFNYHQTPGGRRIGPFMLALASNHCKIYKN